MHRTALRFMLMLSILLAASAVLAPALPPEGAGDLERRAAAPLAELIDGLAGTASAGLWLRLLPLALLYGAAHAALVGNRKLLLVSYFLAEDARPAQGVRAGVVLGLVQVGLAAGIVLIARYMMETGVAGVLSATAGRLAAATGIIAAAVGLLVLVFRIIEYLRTRGDWVEQKYISRLLPVDKRIDPDNEDPAVHLAVAHARQLRRRRRSDAPWLPAIMLAGIAPSPGGAAALSYAIGRGAPLAGLATVALMAVGAAVVLALVSVITIVAKERLVDVLPSRAAHFTHLGLEVAGAVGLIVLGVVFFLS
jgi:ABC-type nickel/cobalt efflux system permease component RcnA